MDQALDLSRVNWEVLAWTVLVVALLATRFWDLGYRALHHDESIHAYYSYLQYQGNPAAHAFTDRNNPGVNQGYDPAYHGPFLYNVVALGYFFFGATDASARLMPAIFGIILGLLCLFLRPYLGRIGTLLAVTLVTFSPSIMYYSRSLRHDIFALVGTMMLFVALLGYLRTHRNSWIYLGAVGLAIAYTSHELIFLNVFIFVTFLVVAWLWLNFLGAPGDRDRTMTVNPISEAVRALFTTGRMALLGGAGIFFAIYAILFSNLMTTPQGLLTGLSQGLTYWFGQHGVSRGNQPVYYYGLLLMPVYELLAYLAGFATLIVLALRTWNRGGVIPNDLPIESYPDRTVHGRGNERERLVVSPSAEGTDAEGYGLPSAALLAGLFVAFVGWWSFGALFAYSLAGEKMPWLNMQIALPFSFLAAAGLGRLVQGVAWSDILKRGGLFMGALGVLLMFAFLSFTSNLQQIFQTGQADIAKQQATMRGLVLAAFILLMVGAIAWLWLRVGGTNGWRVLVMTVVLLLFAYGVRSTWILNFRNGDTPTELLVYTQSSPDTPILAERIARISRELTAFTERNAADVTGGRSLQIGMDTEIEWPFDWYFRDQRKISRFATHTNGQLVALSAVSGFPTGAPLFLVSDDFQARSDWQDYVKDKYTGTRYKLRWWFPEDETTYKVQQRDSAGNPVTSEGNAVWDVPKFVGTYFQTLLNPTAWARPIKYMIYRDPGSPLGSTDVWFYVRNDLLGRAGNVLGDVGGTTATPPPTSNVTYGLFDLAPEGNANGQFNKPRGLAVGPDGIYYVVDTGNFRVQKFDASGKYLLQWGTQGKGDGQFDALNLDAGPAAGTGPAGIVVDNQGGVYVADTWNHRIQKFDSNGKFVRAFGEFANLSDEKTSAAESNSKFFGPRGLATDAQGNLYVTDTGNRRVMMYNSGGQFVRQFAEGLTPALAKVPNNGPNQLNEPIGVAVDGQGNVYVADTNNRRIVKFASNGAALTNWPVEAFTSGPYNEPFLAVAPDGNLLLSDPTGQQVLKYDPTGKLLGSKKAAGATTLSRPTGLTVDKAGLVTVVDTEKPGVVKLGAVP